MLFYRQGAEAHQSCWKSHRKPAIEQEIAQHKSLPGFLLTSPFSPSDTTSYVEGTLVMKLSQPVLLPDCSKHSTYMSSMKSLYNRLLQEMLATWDENK